MKMNWTRLLNSERFGGRSLTPTKFDVRSPFEADFDRIVFSGGFRRLSRKTQVHPLAVNDHVHNRLTHSLEVAAVGRSLGRMLGRKLFKRKRTGIKANTELEMGCMVAAACMAHDLGNPPFGHAGEDSIYHWFRHSGSNYLDGLHADQRHDLEVFEGNAQGFRMITQTENHLFDGGLRLTYGTLATFLKYPYTSKAITGKDKFGAFLSEEKILNLVAKKVGLISKGASEWCRHPLAYLVEAADDICYATIDLEDAVEMGIISFDAAKNILIQALDPKTKKQVLKELSGAESHRVNFTRMRGPVFAALIDSAVSAFLENEKAIMAGEFDGELIKSLSTKNRCREVVVKGKAKAAKDIFPNQRKLELEIGCFSVTESLLEAFCRAAEEQTSSIQHSEEDFEISGKSKLVLKLLRNHAPQKENGPGDRKWSRYQYLRRMLDYVSGMTDNYASHIAGQLRGRSA